MKNLCCILLFLFFFQSVYGEIFYIEIKKEVIEVGEYKNSKSKKKFDTLTIKDGAVEKVKKNLFPDANGKQERILYYIHSWYGGMPIYHKNSLAHLEQINNYDKIICIEWHSEGLRYKKAWENAILQGQRIGKLMNELFTENTNSILCHSMGNRIFEGITQELDKKVKIENIILAAADVDINSFKNGQTLAALPYCVLYVYVNRKDKSLRISKRIHKRERLGLNGADDNEENEIWQQERIVMIDVTATVAKSKMKSSHVYFKSNEVVFNEIKRQLERKKNCF